ncbi:MAG TPA: tetratricopeptide repeat protein [Pseudolabrys sp.]|nr:tetratricopeptide repeat protein [Pseudolabrys sp.]
MTDSTAFRRAGILAAAALLAVAFSVRPATVMAMGTENPPDDGGSKKKKKERGSELETQQQQKVAYEQFLRDYRAARKLIVSGHYKEGITAMHAIGRDDNADVANYIGYAYRKLGDYADSKVWYEKALASDPDHVRTWSYYGMWQMEQGNRLKALDDLQKVKLLCGNTSCKEYRELKDVIDGRASY